MLPNSNYSFPVVSKFKSPRQLWYISWILCQPTTRHQGLISIDSGKGLLPCGTKPLPEPTLINYQSTPGIYWGWFMFLYRFVRRRAAPPAPLPAADFCSCDNKFLDFFHFWHDCWPWPINYLIKFWSILVMTLTLNFQGQTGNLLYLSQKWSDCHETKSKHIHWTQGLKCDRGLTLAMTLTLNFQGQIRNLLYFSIKSDPKVRCKDLQDSDWGDYWCRRLS